MTTLDEMLERRLRSACASSKDTMNPCLLAALEHLEAGGRRVRAKICMHAALRLGLGDSDSVHLASVCELLHNASLIQDDLLDRTPTRRGAASIWEKHGDMVAVCSGDLLLSAAFGVLSEISKPSLIGPALRLVHLRTEELILGETAAGMMRNTDADNISSYERSATGKSGSLLSLSLELPLLLSGNAEHQAHAHKAATDFAIVYQIADDFADFAQDARERSPNLLLMLMEREHLTALDAYETATKIAAARLKSMSRSTELLPNGCAQFMVIQAEMLRAAIAEHSQAALEFEGAVVGKA